jgi:hypothetical protein
MEGIASRDRVLYLSFVPCLLDFVIIQHVISNNECWPFQKFVFKKMRNVITPPTSIILLLHAKVVTKVVATITYHLIIHIETLEVSQISFIKAILGSFKFI